MKEPSLSLSLRSVLSKTLSLLCYRYSLSGNYRSPKLRSSRYAVSLDWVLCEWIIRRNGYNLTYTALVYVVFYVRTMQHTFTTSVSTPPFSTRQRLIRSAYDITWVAYYGWIWTALEADLAVICASAPALKVFFRRYFSVNSTRYGYAKYGTDSRRTPGPQSSTAKLRGKELSHSASHITAGGTYDNEVPMNGIKVSQGLDVHIDDRDDVSQKSYTSTRDLTALPMPQDNGWHGSSQWIQGCRTVCAALRPSSRGSSQTRNRERDMETGVAK